METDTGNTPKQNTGNTGSPYVKNLRGPAALATSKIKNFRIAIFCNLLLSRDTEFFIFLPALILLPADLL